MFTFRQANLALGLALIAATTSCIRDRVQVIGALPSTEVGLHYDGIDCFGNPIRACVKRDAHGDFRLWNVRPEPLDALVAYGVGRAPRIKFAEWSGESDSESVTLAPAAPLKIVIWLADGLKWGDWIPNDSSKPRKPEDSFSDTATLPAGATLRRLIESAVATTRSIFYCERFGVRVIVQYGSAIGTSTSSKSASEFAEAAVEQRSKIDAVNIYVVKKANGHSGGGMTIGLFPRSDDKFVAVTLLGFRSAEPLLAHELGHHLGLVHTDSCTHGFDQTAQTNFMDEDSGISRRHVTEGQTLRAHFSRSTLFHSLSTSAFQLPNNTTKFKFDSTSGGHEDSFGHYPPHCWRVWKDTEPANDTPGKEHACGPSDHDCGDGGTGGDRFVSRYLRAECGTERKQSFDSELKEYWDTHSTDHETIRQQFQDAEKLGFSLIEAQTIRDHARRLFLCRHKYASAQLSRSRPAVTAERRTPWTQDEYVELMLERANAICKERGRQGLKVIGPD